MTKKVTLADIARTSKVSLSTVSLVLRDKPGIPAETRQRIFETAQALGVSLDNVKTRLHRARLWLRERLAGYFTELARSHEEL